MGGMRGGSSIYITPCQPNAVPRLEEKENNDYHQA